ncbi:radical SAM family heme chaperone HemW [Mangrovitalea sediminis]|uniref:radical SAM family heme chaperone HemW n=1 Tax=Mangrovitalea sediminis TaxID=1982043 RepID=UPI001D0CEF65|nr:radical SAM family heme chaperone HemW [Mangrovitalea sediminis]
MNAIVPPGGLQAPPLSLYIHVPWCVRKCPYCDFNSHAASGSLPEDAYLQALLEDLQEDLGAVQGRQVDTLFFGGGTPSLLSPAFYTELLRQLRRFLDFADDAEITLEANPGTVEQSRFEGFRAAGINRLSLGIQSFNDRHLLHLGRIHDSEAAKRAIDAARRAGFDNFNLDLMHCLPDQDEEDAVQDLQTALSFEPPHLSWYQLTIEPNTEFYSRPPALPEDDTLWAIHEAGGNTLRSAGYDAYEISAWSRPGCEARHNLNYWTFGDYLALGAGAHGKITWPDKNLIQRYWKTRQPQAYLNRVGSRTAGRQEIERDERPLEFLMNALRLREGTEESQFEARTGLPLDVIAEPLERARRDGLIVADRLQATPTGQRYLNGLLERFL